MGIFRCERLSIARSNKPENMKLISTIATLAICVTGQRAGAIKTPGLSGSGYWPWVFGGQGIWTPQKPQPVTGKTWGCWAGYAECETFTNPRTKEVKRVRWRQAACLDQTKCTFPLMENKAVTDEEYAAGACNGIVVSPAPEFCLSD